MLGFGSKSAYRCGAIIDIGSGSVGAAIVAYDPSSGKSDIVWSHREFTLLRTSTTLVDAERAVKTAFVNVFLELGNAGVRALAAHRKDAQIQTVQVSLAAPWQYTATKMVNFKDEKPFVVDHDLLKDLTKRAHEQGEKEANESQLLQEFGLTLIAQDTIGTTVNGYAMTDAVKKHAKELSFVHISMLGVKSMVDTVRETQEKILPRAKLSMTSFVFMFYSVVMRLYPHTLEAAIIDITKEATELGIVRDGALRFVGHIPVGSFTLARAISEQLSIPPEEAFTYLKTNTDYGIASIPEKHKSIVDQVFGAYNDELKVLLGSTGDDLSIPRSIFIHTELHTELFFNKAIKAAANELTATEHTIHPVTSKLITESHSGDTAILLGVRHWLDAESA